LRGGVVGTVTWEGPSEWSHMVDDAGSVRAATLGKRILAGAFDWGVMWGSVWRHNGFHLCGDCVQGCSVSTHRTET